MTSMLKKALVTGGSVRLGRAIAIGLAEWGADVAITYTHSRERADQTVEDIRSLGRQSFAIPADFYHSPMEMATIIKQTKHTFGYIDILVNNAAIFESGN